jgi:uncharacterized protein
MNWLQSASGLTPATLALAALMTFGAASIRGLTGFGMAIILVPLLGMLIRPDEAVVLAIFLQLLVGPVGLQSILTESHKASAFLIGGAAVMATPFGIWALAHTAPDPARLVIAAIAIGAFVLVIAARRQSAIPGPLATIATGLAAGILTGFAAMPGPPVVPFYMRDAFQPRTARASMMLVFFMTAIAGTLAAILLGLATFQIARLSLLLLIPMLAGNWLGGLAFGKVSPTLWRGLVALLLGVAGLSALVRLVH